MKAHLSIALVHQECDIGVSRKLACHKDNKVKIGESRGIDIILKSMKAHMTIARM